MVSSMSFKAGIKSLGGLRNSTKAKSSPNQASKPSTRGAIIGKLGKLLQRVKTPFRHKNTGNNPHDARSETTSSHPSTTVSEDPPQLPELTDINTEFDTATIWTLGCPSGDQSATASPITPSSRATTATDTTVIYNGISPAVTESVETEGLYSHVDGLDRGQLVQFLPDDVSIAGSDRTIELDALDETAADNRSTANKIEHALHTSSMINFWLAKGDEVPIQDCNFVPMFGKGYCQGHEDGYLAGHAAGHQAAYEAAWNLAREEAVEQGRQQGHVSGYEEGHAQGYQEGHEEGVEEGHEEGVEEGHQAGYQEGLTFGLGQGFGDGFSAGHTDGFNAGREAGVASCVQDIQAIQSEAYNRGLSVGHSESADSNTVAYENGFNAGLAAADEAAFQAAESDLIAQEGPQEPVTVEEQEDVDANQGPTTEHVRQFVDTSLNEADWIPISDVIEGQHLAVCYLPTIIHENSRILSKFLDVLRDNADAAPIYEGLQAGKDVFAVLEKFFAQHGLLDNVVEYLKPANHPNRILERLEKLQADYQLLNDKYYNVQQELHQYNGPGAAEDILGEERAAISVSQHEELVFERDSWREKFENLRDVQQPRLDKLEEEGRPLQEKMKVLEQGKDLVDRTFSFLSKQREQASVPHTGAPSSNAAFDELGFQYVQLQTQYLELSDSIAQVTAENVQLQHRLRQQKSATGKKEVELLQLNEDLREARELYDKEAFHWDFAAGDYQDKIDHLEGQVEACHYRRLLSPEQLSAELASELSVQVKTLNDQLAETCAENESLRVDLNLARSHAPYMGEILKDAANLKSQRLPTKIWHPPREWNTAYSQDSTPVESESADLVDDSQIF